MEKTQLREELQRISREILKPGDFHDTLAPAITDYAALLSQIVKIEQEETNDRTHMPLEFGNAIGTFWAANCVKEVFRTQRFVRALYLAIKDQLATKKGPVQVLYAGTGPFATLALPVMIQFSPEEVQFTMLEVNENSYNKLWSVIGAFDLHQYVKHAEIADATTYVLPNHDIDIVISETLNRALITEPQVFIMLNMARQLGDEVVYLPEEITVNLCSKKKNEVKPTYIKTLINFNAAKMKEIIARSEGNKWVFDEINVQLNEVDATELYYATEIKVYRDNFLGFEESSLNLLEKVKTDQKDSECLIFKYFSDGKPGFKAYSDRVLQN